MASLSSILSIASSGLSAVSTQLEVTSSNVTNASVEGYTRKTAVLSSANLGEVGGGVKVTGFTRDSDDALFSSLSKATSDASYRSKQDEYMQNVMDILGTSSSDNPELSTNITSFVNAWTALESEPESSIAQQQVIEAGSTLADTVKSTSSSVESLDRQCATEIRSSLTDLNSYLTQIQDLNTKIGSATATGGTAAADLQDKRDQLVLKVADFTNVNVMERDNGRIALYTTSGYQLLDGNSVASLSYDGADVVSDSSPSVSLNSTLTGGSIQALVDFRDTSSNAADSTVSGVGVVQKMRDQLDLIADAFLSTTTTATSGEDTFASAYNSGTTATGELASDFFTGTDRTDFAVNSGLLDSSLSVKTDSISAVVDAMLDSTRVFSTSGLSETGSSYATIVSASLTDFQQAANSISSANDTATSMQSYLNEKYTNETNVTVDDEMVNLVTFQNIYSANARILSAVQDMFTVLENMVS